MAEFNAKLHGRQSKCKACEAKWKRQYYQSNQRNILEHKRQYRRHNRTKILESLKKHYRANREKLLEQKQRYWKERRDELIKQQRHYYEANKAAFRENNRRYREEHKDRLAELSRQRIRQNPAQVLWLARQRRAREAAVTRNLIQEQWKVILLAYTHCCAYCAKLLNGRDCTQDYIVPLKKGGPHTASNIIPTCRSCNSRKGHRGPLPFAIPIRLHPYVSLSV